MATPSSSSNASNSNRGWIKNLPSIASRIYFFLIILQIPLFRVPCRSGTCSTPIHVTSCQLIASEIFPVPVVKALLYPGAVAHRLVTNMTVPRWENLLIMYNLTAVKEAPAVTDLQRLERGVVGSFVFTIFQSLFSIFLSSIPISQSEVPHLNPHSTPIVKFPTEGSVSDNHEVVAGSYFSVAGAIVGILKPGRMSMFGTLLIIWGLVKEGILGKPANSDSSQSIYVYPTMFFALICAFSSVKYDMKKVTRKAPPRPLAKPLQSSSKSKLK